MLSSLGFAGLLAFRGTFAAVIWTPVLGVSGAPGSPAPSLGARYANRALVRTGTAITFLVDAYLLLAFAGLVVRLVQRFLQLRPEAPAWPLWAMGFWLFVRWPALLEAGWGWLPSFRL